MPLGEGVWYDPDGRVLTGSISLAPYTSTVLVRCLPPELVPTERKAPAAGREGWVTVAATADTKWTPVSNADWIVLARSGNRTSEGQGVGAVRYVVLPNTGKEPRTGTLTIAGKTHTIVQAGAAE